jgi:hypothetical protein
VMKSRVCRPGGAGRRTVVAGLALSALVSCSAAAQQADPSRSADLAVPSLAAAQARAAAPADPGYITFFKSTELGGLVDGYYSWNSTRSPALYRSFDTAHNAFTVSMAEVWWTKTPTEDSRAGFKIRLNFGPAATAINFNEPNKDLANVQEGFVSYLAPVGKGLQFDFGKFVTNAGAEVMEAKDDWNYSRSLLFQNAVPIYHAGLRATYTVNDTVSVMTGVVNGWNNVNENNTGKTLMASITVKLTAPLSIAENYITGPEKPGTNEGWRHLSDTVISYTVNPKVSVLGNIDYGQEPFDGTTNYWWGVAGYVKYQATPVVALVPRFEYFDDPQGNQTLTAQKLKSATFTLELKPVANFVWRIEYRGDFSDQEVFTSDTGVAMKRQQSLIFALLYSFSTK